MAESTPCALCGRAFALAQLTRHHCRPRQKGGTTDDVALICSQCHGMVHATYTNETLAALYPTVEQLRRAPELARFLRWVRKQPPTRRKRNADRRRKI
ncbi:MAG TPA: HNH endonuclease [Gemmataceae bacterium]|nr:HNH endonuclease [Gemmataceae bacterium]